MKEQPKFLVGQKIRVLSGEEPLDTIITHIEWSDRNERYFYYFNDVFDVDREWYEDESAIELIEDVIEEPKSPNVGDKVILVLKQIESYCQSITPDRIFKDGKFINYTGATMFVQYIRTYVVLSNGSSFEDKIRIDLQEKDKSKFQKKGFYEKKEGIWVLISSDDFYKKINN